MRFLFLGLGKSNSAIADFVEGEKWAFQEASGKTQIRDLNEVSTSWQNRPGNFDDFDWAPYLPAKVFISPGIDTRRRFFSKLKDFEVRELDFFCEHFKKPVLCVTGTDGKSTFTLQIGEILKRALPDRKIFVGGNLGTGMASALGKDFDLAVLEVSSFQAERLKSAEPDLSILLNLDIDHLDRYSTLEDYHLAKWTLLERSKSVAYPRDLHPPIPMQNSVADFSSHQSIFEILKSILPAIGKKFGFSPNDALLKDLPTLPHRLQFWKEDNGGHRIFVDDSKATTVHAMLYGLEIVQKRFPRVVLALGGQYKGDDFSRVSQRLRTQDRLLLFGAAREIIDRQIQFSGARESYLNLKELVAKVLPNFPEESVFLLSPACSSYDEFKNFEERGKFFVEAVRKYFAVNSTSSCG